MSDTVNNWREQAEYDLETARAMLDAGRFLYVLFCCQQAIEKALKALIIQQTGNLPPRVHNLIQLTESINIDLPVDKRKFLGELTAYYIQSRYPDEIRKMSSTIKKDLAEKTLEQTETIVKWLLSVTT